MVFAENIHIETQNSSEKRHQKRRVEKSVDCQLLSCCIPITVQDRTKITDDHYKSHAPCSNGISKSMTLDDLEQPLYSMLHIIHVCEVTQQINLIKNRPVLSPLKMLPRLWFM